MSAVKRAPVVIEKQKKHLCPICGESVRLFKAMQGRMRGRCGQGHEHSKRDLILR